jgi:cell division protein FtsW
MDEWRRHRRKPLSRDDVAADILSEERAAAVRAAVVAANRSAKGDRVTAVNRAAAVKEEAVMESRLPKTKGDFFLVILVLILVIFGVIMVFSSSYYDVMDAGKSPYHFLIRGMAWAAGGLILMAVMSLVPYKIFYMIAPGFMAVSLILLALLFTPLGTTINRATRWISIGPITFMPGEITKIAIILFMAWYFTKYAKYTRSLLKGFLPPILFVGVCFLLIYKQPNLSTAIIVVAVAVAIMFLGGCNILYLVAMVGAGVCGVVFMVLASDGEHLSRIVGYLDPFSDSQGEFYQVVQGLLALGAGGVTGTGPGQSVQKALYLPAAQNDYIFAVIGEELGFLGCLALLLVFLTLIWRCVLIAMNAPDRLSMLVASGITIMVAVQVIFNIGVVVNLLPPTGIILPFISYGGNAMLLFMGCMGILYHISKCPETAAARKKQAMEARRRGSKKKDVGSKTGAVVKIK